MIELTICDRQTHIDPANTGHAAKFTFHCSLKSINWIYFCYKYSGAKSSQRLSTSLSNISITSNECYFPSKHDVSSSLDTINK